MRGLREPVEEPFVHVPQQDELEVVTPRFRDPEQLDPHPGADVRSFLPHASASRYGRSTE